MSDPGESFSFKLPSVHGVVNIAETGQGYALTTTPVVTIYPTASFYRLRVECLFDPNEVPKSVEFAMPDDERFRRKIQRHLKQFLPQHCEDLHLIYANPPRRDPRVTYFLCNATDDDDNISNTTQHEWIEVITKAQTVNQ